MEAVQKVKDFFLQRQDPKELVRKWQSEMRSQQRALDRQIRGAGRPCGIWIRLDISGGRGTPLSRPAPPTLRRHPARGEEGAEVDQGGRQAQRPGLRKGAALMRQMLASRLPAPLPPGLGRRWPAPPGHRAPCCRACTPVQRSWPARTRARTKPACPVPTSRLLLRLAVPQHLAKEIVQSRRTISRLYTNKAQLISLNTSLTEQLGAPPARSTCCPRAPLHLLQLLPLAPA